MVGGRKRKQVDEATTTSPQDPKVLKSRANTSASNSKINKVTVTLPIIKVPGVPQDMEPQLLRISQSGRTDFEKRVWTALCQIPRGCVTTYGLLSAHLGTSPRAVGNALRRNPFAPEVPCHRVVATGGALGGFKGSWPRDGEGITITEKKQLLKGEGIKLDDKGKVLGTVWSGFK